MNIFSIPLGLPFLKILAIHLLKQYDAYTLARAIVYLPTRQACRTFRKVLFHEAGNKALLKPRVIPLNELEETASIIDLSGYPNVNSKRKRKSKSLN